MGYRVWYNLSLHRNISMKSGVSILEAIDDTEAVEIIDKLRSTNSHADMAFDSFGYAVEDISWYEDENEMKEFSKGYPDIIFKMECDDSGDQRWINYFHNGKMQSCEGHIVYDDFNINNFNE